MRGVATVSLLSASRQRPGTEHSTVQPARLSIERACYTVTELARRAERAEEHDLLCVVVLVGLDEVSLPAARIVVGTASALAANEVEGSHDAMIAPAVSPA